MSAGTERMLVQFGKANWLDKARQPPDRKWGRGILQEAGLAKTNAHFDGRPEIRVPGRRGLERQAHELAKALIQGGDAVHALSSHFYPSPDDIELIDDVCVHRVKWILFERNFSLDIGVSQLHRVYESLVLDPNRCRMVL